MRKGACWSQRPVAEDTGCMTASSLLNIEEPAFSRQGKSNISTQSLQGKKFMIRLMKNNVLFPASISSPGKSQKEALL